MWTSELLQKDFLLRKWEIFLDNHSFIRVVDFIQNGHWKTENPLVTFPNEVIKKHKKTRVCKSYFCLISFGLSVAIL